MAYQATVYRILIASPSDVTAERKAIPEVINAWNATHSEDYSVVLMPVMWETHSTPEMGDRPQGILNKQIVASCDLLVATFWTRMGSPTGVAESGSVEEIEEIRKAGREVLLYFSSVPVILESVDTEQYRRLKEFKEKCQKEGLVEKYDTIPELREKLNRHLTQVVRKIHGEPEFVPTKIDESIRSVDSIKEQLRTLLTRAEVDWTTEKDGAPMNIVEGQYILENFTSELLDFRGSLEGVAEESVLKNLESQISNLKKLQKHKLKLDGGASYRDFWNKGDEIFDALKSMAAEVAYKTPLNTGGLEEEKIKILKLLVAAEESGRDEMKDTDISSATELSLTVTRFHLNSLDEDKYVYVSFTIGQPPLYSIDQKGREYLIKNGLI